MMQPRDGNTEPARLVYYELCVSVVFVTLRRPSRVHKLRRREWGVVRGLPYTLVSLLVGWWGVPWGLIYTPLTLWTNLTGGRQMPCLPGPAVAGSRPD
jgi:hypothetical protein